MPLFTCVPVRWCLVAMAALVAGPRSTRGAALSKRPCLARINHKHRGLTPAKHAKAIGAHVMALPWRCPLLQDLATAWTVPLSPKQQERDWTPPVQPSHAQRTVRIWVRDPWCPRAWVAGGYLQRLRERAARLFPIGAVAATTAGHHRPSPPQVASATSPSESRNPSKPEGISLAEPSPSSEELAAEIKTDTDTGGSDPSPPVLNAGLEPEGTSPPEPSTPPEAQPEIFLDTGCSTLPSEPASSPDVALEAPPVESALAPLPSTYHQAPVAGKLDPEAQPWSPLPNLLQHLPPLPSPPALDTQHAPNNTNTGAPKWDWTFLHRKAQVVVVPHEAQLAAVLSIEAAQPSRPIVSKAVGRAWSVDSFVIALCLPELRVSVVDDEWNTCIVALSVSGPTLEPACTDLSVQRAVLRCEGPTAIRQLLWQTILMRLGCRNARPRQQGEIPTPTTMPMPIIRAVARRPLNRTQGAVVFELCAFVMPSMPVWCPWLVRSPSQFTILFRPKSCWPPSATWDCAPAASARVRGLPWRPVRKSRLR